MTRNLILGIPLMPIPAVPEGDPYGQTTELVAEERKSPPDASPAFYEEMSKVAHNGLYVGQLIQMPNGTVEIIEIISPPNGKASLATAMLEKSQIGNLKQKPQSGHVIKCGNFTKFESNDKVAENLYHSFCNPAGSKERPPKLSLEQIQKNSKRKEY